MKYEIIFKLNAFGQQIVGKDTRSFTTDIDETNDIQKQIETFVTQTFPKNLYVNYQYWRSFEDAKIGDIVEMHNPKNGGIQLGEISSVSNNEILVFCRNDKGEKCYHDSECIRFNIIGREIGPNEKNKRWIHPATQDEKEQYMVLLQYDEMVEDIINRVYSIPTEYEALPSEDYKIITDLSADQLKRIIDIFNE
ncbi:MAG: hypothetical protein [Wendovervirus sonii]|uniref:Uncharacterized protein n=1 Tax=phage Lak_Megaphage_Sonny TaxID=3109229 RepID=A0ABZ0Z5F0_9CAUD|nr:MAG: hypothetical protein [phage Lak_Megaphage_Sonny]